MLFIAYQMYCPIIKGNCLNNVCIFYNDFETELSCHNCLVYNSLEVIDSLSEIVYFSRCIYEIFDKIKERNK